MASSLERSLELAALHSDGLSDKERRVRQVKHNLHSHRRTSSVSIISVLCKFLKATLFYPLQNPTAKAVAPVLLETSSSAESEEQTAIV